MEHYSAKLTEQNQILKEGNINNQLPVELVEKIFMLVSKKSLYRCRLLSRRYTAIATRVCRKRHWTLRSKVFQGRNLGRIYSSFEYCEDIPWTGCTINTWKEISAYKSVVLHSDDFGYIAPIYCHKFFVFFGSHITRLRLGLKSEQLGNIVYQLQLTPNLEKLVCHVESDFGKNDWIDPYCHSIHLPQLKYLEVESYKATPVNFIHLLFNAFNLQLNYISLRINSQYRTNPENIECLVPLLIPIPYIMLILGSETNSFNTFAFLKCFINNNLHVRELAIHVHNPASVDVCIEALEIFLGDISATLQSLTLNDYVGYSVFSRKITIPTLPLLQEFKIAMHQVCDNRNRPLMVPLPFLYPLSTNQFPILKKLTVRNASTSGLDSLFNNGTTTFDSVETLVLERATQTQNAMETNWTRILPNLISVRANVNKSDLNYIFSNMTNLENLELSNETQGIDDLEDKTEEKQLHAILSGISPDSTESSTEIRSPCSLLSMKSLKRLSLHLHLPSRKYRIDLSDLLLQMHPLEYLCVKYTLNHRMSPSIVAKMRERHKVFTDC